MGDEEEKENPCANFVGKKFGEWLIVDKLDEGGFGQVYKVESKRDGGKVAALKAEPNDVEGGSAIKLEMYVLRQINADGEKIHLPTVYHAAKHKKYCYMVMMLLGDNLKHLRAKCEDNKMSPGTWSRIAVQCLYGIKLVHDYGFIHRDIKPNNFVMGHGSDPQRARIVHILDFGLTRSYATKKGPVWVARRARGSAEFRGTLRYCSPNVHRKQEQGRRDDLWGLLYVLIEFHCELPWQRIHEKQGVEAQKINIKDEDLMKYMPEEVKKLPGTLRKLNCYERPNYSEWANAFKAIYTRLNIQYWDKFDWEKSADVEKIKTKVKGQLPAWAVDGDAFFASDPIKINGPPPREAGKNGAESDAKSRPMGKSASINQTKSSEK